MRRFSSMFFLFLLFPLASEAQFPGCVCPFDSQACVARCPAPLFPGDPTPLSCSKGCYWTEQFCQNPDAVYPQTVFRPSSGTWYQRSEVSGSASLQWGLPGDLPISAGGVSPSATFDARVWRPSNGSWYQCLGGSANANCAGGYSVTQFGLRGDIPVPGNLSRGVGYDTIIWRPSNGVWYALNSATGQAYIEQFGLPGDIPFLGNFDGDGSADLGVWRNATGRWYVKLSSKPATDPSSVLERQWGLPGDSPVAGQYDNDSITDLAVWRPSNGTWYICPSTQGFNCASGFAVQFGLPGDVPIPSTSLLSGYRGLYSVWRPSTRVWYRNYTEFCVQTQDQWGLPGDFPIGASPRELLNLMKRTGNPPQPSLFY